jgi:rhamnosyltransferase
VTAPSAETGAGSSGGATIAAVVVSFNPDEGLAQRLRATAVQVSVTVVVDNSTSGAGEDVRRLCDSLGYRCIVNGRNLGMGEALNQGVRDALSQGATHILTMDQDSTPAATMVAELLRALDAARGVHLAVGLAAATSVDAVTGRQSGTGSEPREWSESTLAITSGSLIPISVFGRVGLFRADYFIDSIDHEFCLRIRRHGYRIIRAHRAGMLHKLGAPKVEQLLGLSFIPTNHSPIRRFYMARNIMWTTKLFLFSETRAVVTMTLKLLKNSLLIVLFEDQKVRKLGAIALGLARGLATRPSRVPTLA